MAAPRDLETISANGRSAESGRGRYIGRVGALAVALGVGAAVTSLPAVAAADANGPAGATGSSSSSSATSSSEADASSSDTGSVTSADSAESSASDTTSGSTTSDSIASGTATPDLDDPLADVPDIGPAEADVAEPEPADLDPPVIEDPEDASNTLSSPGRRGSDASSRDDETEDSALSVPAAPSPREVEISTADLTALGGEDPSGPIDLAPPVASTGGMTVAGAPDVVAAVPESPSAVSEMFAADATTDQSTQAVDNGLDVPATALGLAALAFASRRESGARSAAMAPQPVVAELAAPADSNVLVIGLDGTRLSAILADPANVNLFALMAGGDIVTAAGTTPIVGGTTAASTIVGHTTVSLPSWTTILGGVWSETAGVINNVYYSKTADAFPTTFNTLEAAFGDDIQTMAIANWIGTAAISDATSGGTPGADVVQYVEDFANDPIWTQSDDRVAELTIQAIQGINPGCGGPCPVPDFLFSYFVGVDNTGHEFGGGSAEYAEALRNVDANVGEIMEAVVASGEDWIVIVTTDHGQSTRRGPIGALAHGFQSPEETTTFVIAWDGKNLAPRYQTAAINNQYSILDISPTVLDLFGGPGLIPTWYQGVPLSDHDASTVKPANPDDLRLALQDAISMYGYPDIVTDLSLATRTIFATVPMVIYDLTNDIVAAVTGFLPGLLGELVALPVRIIGDLLYMATNVPAQIVARLTGVTGASIFPLLPPEPPSPPVAPALPPSPEAEVGGPALSAGGAQRCSAQPAGDDARTVGRAVLAGVSDAPAVCRASSA